MTNKLSKEEKHNAYKYLKRDGDVNDKMYRFEEVKLDCKDRKYYHQCMTMETVYTVW